MPSSLFDQSMFDLPAAADLPAVAAKRYACQGERGQRAAKRSRQEGDGTRSLQHNENRHACRAGRHGAVSCLLNITAHWPLPLPSPPLPSPPPLSARPPPCPPSCLTSCSLAVDIKDTGKSLEIVADVPGMNKEDIKVQASRPQAPSPANHAPTHPPPAQTPAHLPTHGRLPCLAEGGRQRQRQRRAVEHVHPSLAPTHRSTFPTPAALPCRSPPTAC